MIILVIPTVATFIMTIRAFLIVVGIYKDPVLASFEDYGTERIFSPTFSLFAWGCAFAYFMLYWFISAGAALSVGLVIGFPLAAFRDTFVRMLYEHQRSFRIFPTWYYQLVENTDREERRRLAYLWLRLPARTRMIYNTHTSIFRLWVEQTLVTIAR